MPIEHQRLPHLTPFSRQALVFLTIVTHGRRPLLGCQIAYDALTAIWSRSDRSDGWFVGRFMLMPDHVHLFARPAINAKPLAAWIGMWKSVSTRMITTVTRTATPFWQRNYFDRFLRSIDNYDEKWRYVVMNPVRKGLCSKPIEWKWQGEIFDLRY